MVYIHNLQFLCPILTEIKSDGGKLDEQYQKNGFVLVVVNRSNVVNTRMLRRC